jgi:hypothetical protein
MASTVTHSGDSSPQAVATLLKDTPPTAKHRGHWRHYRVSPPMKLSGWGDDGARTSEYVIVSAATTYSGPETYIFLADEKGEITDWTECSGSFRGDLDHERALALAGYTITAAAARESAASTLTEFRLTFSNNGWVCILAPDHEAALAKARTEYGTA